MHGPYPATFAAGVAATAEVLESRATAVVPYATAIALGLILTLRGRGVQVPGAVLVSAETTVTEALGVPGIPAIDVDGDALGRAAMDLLGAAMAAPGENSRLRLPVQVTWSRP